MEIRGRFEEKLRTAIKKKKKKNCYSLLHRVYRGQKIMSKDGKEKPGKALQRRVSLGGGRDVE